MIFLSAHASVKGQSPKLIPVTRRETFTKDCVRVDSKEELLAVVQRTREAGVLVQLCVNAGRTGFHGVPTSTCCAVGPNYPERIDPITGHLKPL